MPAVLGQRIVDAHVHLWDIESNYYPWLRDPDAPSHRYGSQAPLRRNYLPRDYRVDSARHQIVATVHVEALFDPTDTISETRWLDRLRRRTGMPTVAVAHANLEDPDIERTLAAHAAFEFVRGIRCRIRLVPKSTGEAEAPRVPFDHPDFVRGFGLLREFGLACDMVVPTQYLADIGPLAARFPETPIIINHCGHPADRSAAGLAAWRAYMTAVAQHRSVSVKVSGVGVRGRPWTIEDNAPIIRETMRIFGPDRCLFASNYPPDSLVTNFDDIVALTDTVAGEFGDAARRAVFEENARQVYRIPFA